MKPNLTDYISTFAAFDPTFDITKANPIVKVKSCYQATNTFLESLEKHSSSFPELKIIRTQLADLNNFFADMILEQTNGALKLVEGANLHVAKSRNKLLHQLAKDIINDPDKFIESIEKFLVEVENELNRSKQTTLDEKKKLDEVDRNLLTNSTTSLGFQDKRFGGAVNINAKTQRSNLSLFTNKDFQNFAVKIESKEELLTIATMLRQFIDRANAVTNKFGFVSEAIQPSTTLI